MKSSIVLGFLHLSLPFVGATSMRRDHEVAIRVRGDVFKYTKARFTFFDDGLGACGSWSGPHDYIVALNAEQFGSGYPGQHCFKKVTICYGGKTAQAVITDKCMGCPWGGLDFSRGLFDHFAPEDKGVLYGEWWFSD